MTCSCNAQTKKNIAKQKVIYKFAVKSIKAMLEKEFKYYLNNQSELVKRYNRRFLVIKDESVVGDFATMEEAYFDSVTKYELGTFLIQECTEGDEAYTQTFHSRVVFA